MPDHRPALRAMAPWLAFIALVIVLDQVTKEWALAYFQSVSVRRIEVAPFFDLVLAFNRGAAFSFLAEHSGWQRWFFATLAVAVSIWLLMLTWQHRFERLLPSSFSLIIGGALGNVIDRFNHGAVVDFLSFHAGSYYWPAFNIADSAITIGVALMLIGQFRSKKNALPENPT